jgi:hypothetical protein
MYWKEIIQLITWPVLIFVTYRLVLYFLVKLDKKLAEDGEE